MIYQNEMMSQKGEGHFLKHLSPLTRKWLTLHFQDDTTSLSYALFCLSPSLPKVLLQTVTKSFPYHVSSAHQAPSEC
jgi:hypothetical protein